MKAVYHHLAYLDEERIYHFSEIISENLQIDLYVQIYSEKFIEYQKEIFQEFIASFIEKMRDPDLIYSDLHLLIEQHLQMLNEKLKNFSSKLRDMPPLELKGYLQVIADQVLISSMVGDTSLVIFRDEKLYYSLANSPEKGAELDLFSDIVEGEVQMKDCIVYAGTKIKDSFNQHDFEELEQFLSDDTPEAMLKHFGTTLSSRIPQEHIWFLASYSINLLKVTRRFVADQSYLHKISSKLKIKQASQKAKKFFSLNSYYTMVGVLVLLVLFLIYIVSSQLGIINSQSVLYVDTNGKEIQLTIDDIKKDIYAFQTLDPSSNEKSLKYSEILDKLWALEKNEKWLADTQVLRTTLDDIYNQGFRIITIKSLSDFDDPINATTTRTLTFNNSEKSTMGNPVSIQVGEGVHIWGSKGGIIGSLNDSNRGSLVEFNMGSEVEDCSLSLSSRGLFCYTNLGAIFNVTKVGVENMESAAGDWSTKDIWGIGTYNKTNFYVFQKNANNFASVFVTRYRNIPGSEMNYQVGQNYSLLQNTGMTVPSSFNGFSIDGNFMAWGDGKLYQLYRTTSSSNVLDMREVELRGGDQTTSNYSSKVKVIASQNSPYVYLFDKNNQTFTVYDSSPIKTHESYTKNFNLYYLFRFKFDLGISKDGNKLNILDAAIPADSGTIPELYLLSNEGVNKIKLHEFIDSLKDNKNLKSLSN